MHQGNVGKGTKAVQYFQRTTEIYNAINDQILPQLPILDDSVHQRQTQGMS